MKNYESEARARWGDTDAFREHEQKTKNYTKEKWTQVNEGLMAIFAEFAACKARGDDAASDRVQSLVEGLRAYLTEHYYTCTDQILAGLGKMYACDERFRSVIDQSGEGTAEFAEEGIRIYVEKK